MLLQLFSSAYNMNDRTLENDKNIVRPFFQYYINILIILFSLVINLVIKKQQQFCSAMILYQTIRIALRQI